MFTLAGQGPLPAWNRLNKHTRSQAPAPSSLPGWLSLSRHLHPTPDPLLSLQILLTDYVWGLLYPADTWQDIPKPVCSNPQNRGKVGVKGHVGRDRWPSFSEARFPHLQNGDKR